MAAAFAGARFSLLGSGNSTAVPWLKCVIDPASSCPVCKDCVLDPLSRNRRNNPSGVISFAHPDGRARHVLVDVGKTFRDAVQRHFPRLGIARVDAVILTHGHMDAFGGLDDLRDVSPNVLLPVYLSSSCMEVVQRTFSYLVKPPATKGLFISHIEWRIIHPWQPFEVEGGLLVTPLPVEHGPPLTMLGFEFRCVVAPSSALRVGGESGEEESAVHEGVGGGETSSGCDGGDEGGARGGAGAATRAAESGRLVYISDVAALPADTRAFLLDGRPIALLVLDALSRTPYPTHFSLGQAFACAADLRASGTTVLVGMNHAVDVRTEGPALAAAAAEHGLRCEMGYDGWECALKRGQGGGASSLHQAEELVAIARAAAPSMPHPTGGSPMQLEDGRVAFTYRDAAQGLFPPLDK